MSNESYTVHLSSDVAGIALRVASTSEAQLATHVPSMEVYGEQDSVYAFSDKNERVVMTAMVEPLEDMTSRVLVGVRDRKRKTVTLYPAAGNQVAMLHPRLSGVRYHSIQSDEQPGQDLSERLQRYRQYRQKSALVHAFGSTRRVKKLTQNVETMMLDQNVVSRGDIEEAVEELGKQAEGSGLTSKQVMSRVSAARTIPPHNPDATTAHEAYKVAAVLSEEDLQNLDVNTLRQVLQQPEMIQPLKAAGSWMKLNAFVRLVIQMKMGPGFLEVEADECSKWLALLQVCCSVLKQGRYVEFDESSNNLVQNQDDEKQEAEDADVFAEKKKKTLPMATFAKDCGFVSAQAAKYWLSKFGDATSLSGMTVYKTSESQKLLLNTTTALCAIRCNENKMNTDMMTALLRVVSPSSAQEVSGWFKQIGCNTTAVKIAGDVQTFTASLLNSRGQKTLASCLPNLNKRKSRG